MLFKRKNDVLLFLDVLQCHIHENTFLYTFRKLEIDQFQFHLHITYRFCHIKPTFIVGREVTESGSVNLCTPFCSYKSSKRLSHFIITRGLNSIWVLITPKTSWNTSLMPDEIQPPSLVQMYCSSILVGNYLEMVPRLKYWALSPYWNVIKKGIWS